jgi:hypothetical protein
MMRSELPTQAKESLNGAREKILCSRAFHAQVLNIDANVFEVMQRVIDVVSDEEVEIDLLTIDDALPLP